MATFYRSLLHSSTALDERGPALKPESYHSLLTLWTMGTYVHRIFRYYPYLWIQGSHPRCGKSVLLETLRPLVFNGLLCAGLSGRNLYGLTDSAVTLLLDEVYGLQRTPFRRALLSSGFRNGPVVPVWERRGDGFTLREYTTYSPKVLTGDTEAGRYLWDKCLTIPMAPKVPGQTSPRSGLGENTSERLPQLRDNLHIFGLNYAAEIARRYAERTYPFGLSGVRDRELDLWQPLFVLAHLVDQEHGSEHVTEALMELR